MTTPQIPMVTLTRARNGDPVIIAITDTCSVIDFIQEAALLAETLDNVLPFGTWDALMEAMQRRNAAVEAMP